MDKKAGLLKIFSAYRDRPQNWKVRGAHPTPRNFLAQKSLTPPPLTGFAAVTPVRDSGAETTLPCLILFDLAHI